jgi:hypothetical protein
MLNKLAISFHRLWREIGVSFQPAAQVFRDRHSRGVNRGAILDFREAADQLTLRILLGAAHRDESGLALASDRIAVASLKF